MSSISKSYWMSRLEGYYNVVGLVWREITCVVYWCLPTYRPPSLLPREVFPIGKNVLYRIAPMIKCWTLQEQSNKDFWNLEKVENLETIQSVPISSQGESILQVTHLQLNLTSSYTANILAWSILFLMFSLSHSAQPVVRSSVSD